MGKTEADGKEVQATLAPVKLNQMTGGNAPAQGHGPLLAGAGAGAAGGKQGADAEEDQAKLAAAPAQTAKQPGKSSGPNPDECTAPGHPVDAVTGHVIDDEVELELPGAFLLQVQSESATHRREISGQSARLARRATGPIVTCASGDGVLRGLRVG